MAATNDSRKMLYDVLVTACDRVYYEEADDDAVLPYIVFSFPSETDAYKNRVRKLLSVNVFDVRRSDYNAESEIEDLTDEVDRLLDHNVVYYGDVIGWCRHMNRISVPFPQDSNMMQRELTYELRMYKE